jgi:hypothetical protein
MRSKKIKLGLEALLIGRGEGEKKGTVGIHEEFHTKKIEAL